MFCQFFTQEENGCVKIPHVLCNLCEIHSSVNCIKQDILQNDYSITFASPLTWRCWNYVQSRLLGCGWGMRTMASLFIHPKGFCCNSVFSHTELSFIPKAPDVLSHRMHVYAAPALIMHKPNMLCHVLWLFFSVPV